MPQDDRRWWLCMFLCLAILRHARGSAFSESFDSLVVLQTQSRSPEDTGKNVLTQIHTRTGGVLAAIELPDGVTTEGADPRHGLCTSTASRFEGRLALSGDRKAVTLACMDVEAGTFIADSARSDDGTQNGVRGTAAIVWWNGSVDTSTLCSGCFDYPVTPSAAATVDGSVVWFAGSKELWAGGSRLYAIGRGVRYDAAPTPLAVEEGYRSFQIQWELNGTQDLYTVYISTARAAVAPLASRRGIWSLGPPRARKGALPTTAPVTLQAVVDTDTRFNILSSDLQDFAFENPTAVWMLDSGADRCTPFVLWSFLHGRWDATLRRSGPDPCVDMTGLLGRWEPTALGDQWTLYATSLDSVYMLRPYSSELLPQKLRGSDDGWVFRGLSWPPLQRGHASPSPTLSSTPSATATASTVASRTATSSGSRTATSTASSSLTATSSATSSVSPSITVSATRTPSVIATSSSSPSSAPTTSFTPSISPSTTASASALATVTVSPSHAATGSRSPSTTSTMTSSVTATTALPSPSVSSTASDSPASSGTTSSSVSPSATESSSATGSTSKTPSITATSAPSSSESPSSTVTPSVTPSVLETATEHATLTSSSTTEATLTKSPSSSGSNTPSATATTALPSPSLSTSTSSSATASISVSVSASTWASSTMSPSSSTSASASCSLTTLATASPSQTPPSPTASASVAATTSRGPSPTISITSSASIFPTSSATITQSATTTASPSRASTLSPSASTSMSTSPTPSHSGAMTVSLSPSPTKSETSTQSVTPSSTVTGSNLVAGFRFENLLLTRVGDGAIPLTSLSAPVFIDELDPVSGFIVHSTALPAFGSGACTLPGIVDIQSNAATPIGVLSVSQDRRFVTAACQEAPAGLQSTSDTQGAVVVTDVLGFIETMAPIKEFPFGPASAFTWNGSEIWLSGGGGEAGIICRQAGGSQNVAVIAGRETAFHIPFITVFMEKIYASVISDPAPGIVVLGDASAACTLLQPELLPGLAFLANPLRATSFVFQEMGLQTTRLWAADTSLSGFNIRALRFAGTLWRPLPSVGAQLGPAGTALFALTGRPEPYASDFVLYGTTKDGVYAMAVSSYKSWLVRPAGTNTMFRGVASAPFDAFILARSPSVTRTISPTTTASATATSSGMETPSMTASVSPSTTPSWSFSASSTSSRRATPSASGTSTGTSSLTASPSGTTSTQLFEVVFGLAFHGHASKAAIATASVQLFLDAIACEIAELIGSVAFSVSAELVVDLGAGGVTMGGCLLCRSAQPAQAPCLAFAGSAVMQRQLAAGRTVRVMPRQRLLEEGALNTPGQSASLIVFSARVHVDAPIDTGAQLQRSMQLAHGVSMVLFNATPAEVGPYLPSFVASRSLRNTTINSWASTLLADVFSGSPTVTASWRAAGECWNGSMHRLHMWQERVLELAVNVSATVRGAMSCGLACEWQLAALGWPFVRPLGEYDLNLRLAMRRNEEAAAVVAWWGWLLISLALLLLVGSCTLGAARCRSWCIPAAASSRNVAWRIHERPPPLIPLNALRIAGQLQEPRRLPAPKRRAEPTFQPSGSPPLFRQLPRQLTGAPDKEQARRRNFEEEGLPPRSPARDHESDKLPFDARKRDVHARTGEQLHAPRRAPRSRRALVSGGDAFFTANPMLSEARERVGFLPSRRPIFDEPALLAAALQSQTRGEPGSSELATTVRPSLITDDAFLDTGAHIAVSSTQHKRSALVLRQTRVRDRSEGAEDVSPSSRVAAERRARLIATQTQSRDARLHGLAAHFRVGYASTYARKHADGLPASLTNLSSKRASRKLASMAMQATSPDSRKSGLRVGSASQLSRHSSAGTLPAAPKPSRTTPQASSPTPKARTQSPGPSSSVVSELADNFFGSAVDAFVSAI